MVCVGVECDKVVGGGWWVCGRGSRSVGRWLCVAEMNCE